MTMDLFDLACLVAGANNGNQDDIAKIRRVLMTTAEKAPVPQLIELALFVVRQKRLDIQRKFIEENQRNDDDGQTGD